MKHMRNLLLCSLALAGCVTGRIPDSTSAPVPAVGYGVQPEIAGIVPGVQRLVFRDPEGPWEMQVIEVETAVCRPQLAVLKAEGRLSSLATTTSLAAGTIAAINADFFRAPGGTPVGAHVSNGVVLAGPTEWPVFGVGEQGRWGYGRARLEGHVHAGADSVPLTQVNREATTFTAYQGTTDGVALHTARSDTLPADTAAWLVRLRWVRGDESFGTAVVETVMRSAPSVHVEPGAVALMVRGGAVGWAERRAAGDTVSWRARVVVDDGTGRLLPAHEATGGFPALLLGGRDVLGLQSVRRAFGEARHPRTAIGWTADGSRFFMVVADGRQEHSDGLTLPELVAFMRRLGADEALNLDGGGSTALAVQGRLVNRPSDDDGERPVGNVLALVGCG